MKRRAWRIVKRSRIAGAFDGEGARRWGGRWNSPGVAVVYAAEHESLAALELLVHLHTSQLLAAYVSIPVEFDERLVESVDPGKLPEGWRGNPSPAALAAIGDRWAAERRSALLRVPSALVPSETNYLLLPAHPDFRRVEIGKPRSFDFDPRLGRREAGR